MYRTAFVYLRNREDALDAVQETAYRSFKSISKLKEPQHFKTWLIRIAIRCSVDILRKRPRDVSLRIDLQEAIEEGSGTGDLSLSLSLRELIDTLDEDEKSVVLLRFYHGYTIRETADILELPLGTGKTILYRALKKLRLEGGGTER